MKKFLLGTVALMALGASASAADLAPRYTKAPAMLDAAYNWTGFYIGLNAGAASTDGNLTAVTRDRFFEDRFTDTFGIAPGNVEIGGAALLALSR